MPGKIKVDDQSKRFIEAARELGCDDSEDAFDAKLKKVASAPQESSKKKKPKHSGSQE